MLDDRYLTIQNCCCTTSDPQKMLYFGGSDMPSVEIFEEFEHHSSLCSIVVYSDCELISMLAKFVFTALAAKRNRYQRQKSLMTLEMESQHAKGFIPTYNAT